MVENFITDNKKLEKMFPGSVFLGENKVSSNAKIVLSKIENCEINSNAIIVKNNLQNCVIPENLRLGNFNENSFFMGKNIFSGSGFRAVFNESDFNEELVKKIAKVLALKHKKILCGIDTRESSPEIKKVFCEEVVNCGATIIDVGVVPTPAVSFLIQSTKANFGVMITASHNPQNFNGFKFFNGNGEYLSASEEETLFQTFNALNNESPNNPQKSKIIKNNSAFEKYENFLISYDQNKFDGLKIIADCAGGSSSKIIRSVFKKLHANIIVINEKTEINKNCGSLHPEGLAKEVLARKADLGFAFDGDADRIIVVNRKGQVLDGDDVLYVISWFLKTKNLPNFNCVVGTEITNSGIEKKLHDLGIDLIRTKVGDDYVAKKMKEQKILLGGEASGHIIFANNFYVSDGVLTARILATIYCYNKKIFEVVKNNKVVQVHKSLSVKNKNIEVVLNNAELKTVIAFFEKKLNKTNGKIVVRRSETESKIRIMVECLDKNIANFVANEIRVKIKKC